jgi:hypothetical protein
MTGVMIRMNIIVPPIFSKQSAPMLIVAFDSEECGSGAASSLKGSGAASFSKTYNSHDQTQSFYQGDTLQTQVVTVYLLTQ